MKGFMLDLDNTLWNGVEGDDGVQKPRPRTAKPC